MSEIPSEFFSKNSFNSLPRLAFLTWLFVFIIDAIVLQRIGYSFVRVFYVWVIGMIIAFLFELGRYKNLDPIEKKDYKKYFMILNTFLIFLYASSYSGLTKQIGAWGNLSSTVNGKELSLVSKKRNEANLLLASSEWAIPILANQTSYFPDVTAIAENNQLKEENKKLTEKISGISGFDSSAYVVNLKVVTEENNRLKKELSKVAPADYSGYVGTINSLRRDSMLAHTQVNILLDRIQVSNSVISRFNQFRQIKCISSGEVGALRMFDEMCGPYNKDVAIYKQLLFTRNPIDINLPK